MEQAVKAKRQVRRVREESEMTPMNALALRIWDGQSPDLPLNERVKRIVAALNERGFDEIESLELPVEGFGKYI